MALKRRLANKDQKPAVPRVSEKTVAEKAKEQVEATRKISEMGFNYGEIKSNYVGGNIRFGGQLHDHVVNRWDIEVAQDILKYLGLMGTSNFNDFNESIDQMLRDRFGTNRLEDLHSAEHKAFDDFMHKLIEVMGIQKAEDSRTNVMMDFWLGQGDCRQHAYVKQLLFDVWKSSNINRLLGQAYDALNHNDVTEYDTKMAEVKKLESMQMRVFNSIVKAPIEMVQKYQEKRNEDGKLIASPTLNEVEDHTWNGLMELDENGNIVGFRMVDAFYQNHYRFGGKNPLADGSAEEGIRLDPMEILLGQGFYGGKIKAVGPDGEQDVET